MPGQAASWRDQTRRLTNYPLAISQDRLLGVGDGTDRQRGMALATGISYARDHTALGIAIILASVLAMAFADALVKLVSTDLPVWQIFAARSLVAIAILVAVMRVTAVAMWPRSPKWAYVRAGLLVVTWLAFYAALPVLQLSVAAVVVYTNPILIVLLSALLIGEPVSARQWSGVILGFIGVVTILRPGSDEFSWFMLLPLVAAAAYAFAMVLTRGKCRDEEPLTLGLAVHVSFLLTGMIAVAVFAVLDLDSTTVALYPFLLRGWTALDMAQWGLVAVLGILSAAYFVGVARAYQIAPPSIIATFDYAYLVWAALWGFVLFAETPDLATVIGMVLITAAGLLAAGPTTVEQR